MRALKSALVCKQKMQASQFHNKILSPWTNAVDGFDRLCCYKRITPRQALTMQLQSLLIIQKKYKKTSNKGQEMKDGDVDPGEDYTARVIKNRPQFTIIAI
jgi:hypothetical protein